MKRISNGRSAKEKDTPLSPSRVRRYKWQHRAIDLYLKGHSQRMVRDLLSEETGHSFSSGTINKYIKEGVQEWQASKNDMIADHKAIELEKINRLEMEYWEGWERSKLPYENTSETKVKEGKGAKVTQIKTDKRAMHGDPRFLEGIHRCVEMRNKLLGIEVPAIQINQTTGSGGNSTTIIQRRVVFKTRETTTQQEIPTEEE